jgi:putative transposase
MKAVADTLGVARSNLVEQAKRGGRRPRPPYRKAGDAELLARLRPLVDARPSYGWPLACSNRVGGNVVKHQRQE